MVLNHARVCYSYVNHLWLPWEQTLYWLILQPPLLPPGSAASPPMMSYCIWTNKKSKKLVYKTMEYMLSWLCNEVMLNYR